MNDKFIKVSYSKNRNLITVEKIKSEMEFPNLQFYYDNINTDMIEYASLKDNVDVIVDEEGILKSGNPVLELKLNDGYELNLAGNVILGKSVLTKEGLNTTGFKSEEILKVLNSMEFKLIGFVS